MKKCLVTINLFVVISLSSTAYAENKSEHSKAKSLSEVGEAKKNTRIAKKNSASSAEYHFTLAQAYASDGDPDKSIEEYKLTLMFDPNSSLVYARLATEYIKKGMLSAAMEACKEALKLDSKYIDARLILAGLYSTAHDSESAVAEYDKVLKINSKHEEAVVYKSQVLAEDGQLKKSATVLQQFAQKNPDSSLVLYYLGRAEQQLDHFKEAVQAYKKAMSTRPGFSQAALALGYLYEEKQMMAQAISVYRDLFDVSQDASAASRLATIYLKDEKYQQAIPYLQAIEAVDPDDLNARVKIGLVQMELKQYDKAILTFKKILEKTPDSDRLHYYLGSLYEETKQLDLAIAELKLIKPDSKLFSDAVLHVAYLLRQANQIASAKTFLRNSIDKSPKTSSFYIFQASLEEETKELSSAVKILNQAISEFPADEKVRYYLGSLYDRMGEIDKGLEQMQVILKLNPENVDALNYIGYTWTQKGVNLGEAEKLLRRALHLRPDNGYIQDSWGWYLFTQGKVREAVVELEKAAKLKPNEPTILEHLGDAYLRSNLREKALNQYSDAARYSEDNDSRKKLQTKAESLKREIVKRHPEKMQSNSDSMERVPASQ